MTDPKYDWFGEFKFEISYGIGTHTFSDKTIAYTLNVIDPCLTGNMLSLDTSLLVYDVTIGAFLTTTSTTYDASTRTTQQFRIEAVGINNEPSYCQSHTIRVTPSDATYSTISASNEEIFMDYTGWALSAAPYQQTTTFTVEVFYDLYPALIETHTFDVIEVYCAIRFQVT